MFDLRINMKNVKLKIGFVVILFGVIVFSVTSTTEIEAETLPFDKYANVELRLDQSVELYHKTVNSMFNVRIKALIEALDEDTPLPTAKECLENDIRTYCLAMDALKEYEGYYKALVERRGDYEDVGKACDNEEFEGLVSASTKVLADPASTDEEKAESETHLKQLEELNSPFITKQMGISLKRMEFIDNEIEVAGDALDKTLAAYNELQMAYPIHKENIKLIKNLEEYNKKLAEIRREIESFPGKFIDASTTKCT